MSKVTVARLLVLGLLAAAPRAYGAVVEHDRLTITVGADGTVRETGSIRVRLESDDDVERWSAFPIYLDENRTLEDVEATVLGADGKSRKVGRRQQDVADLSGRGILRSSQQAHLVAPKDLRPGEVLEVRWEVAEDPYFTDGSIVLGRRDAIDDLRVEVRVAQGVEGWRWRVDGPGLDGPASWPGLAVEGDGNGVRATGRLRAFDDEPPRAAGRPQPVLRYGWGRGAEWTHVGAWYGDLLSTVPRQSPEIASLAAELTTGASTPREKLEALLAHARGVRYVAVEIGVGGFRPTPAAETLARSWGDCKDKSLLLIDLLAAAGIEAHPALVRLARGKTFDAAFPSAHQFNHLIVAVPEGQVEVGKDDPVSDGFLFLDPTQTQGGAAYLHPWAQGQQALVVAGRRGILTTTPTRPEHERTAVHVRLRADDAGPPQGALTLDLEGEAAGQILRLAQTVSPTELETRLTTYLRNLLPSARLGGLTWSEVDGAVPAVRAEAALELEETFEVLRTGGSLWLPTILLLPNLRDLDQVPDHRALDADAGLAVLRFDIEVPAAWCAFEPRDDLTENALGRVEQTVTELESDAETETRRFRIVRTSRVDAHWASPEHRTEMRDLAIAENRMQKRRLRAGCR